MRSRKRFPILDHLVSPSRSRFPLGSRIFKYRFVHQTGMLPDIGTFPLVEVPSGNYEEGFGNGRAQYFLPIWAQKDFGKLYYTF